jgi:hypothetical protein
MALHRNEKSKSKVGATKEAADPKAKSAVKKARSVRAAASQMSAEEDDLHFNRAMQMIYGEAAAN